MSMKRLQVQKKTGTSLDFEACWPIDVHDVACVDLAVPQNKSSGLAKSELREEIMVAPRT